MSWNDDAKKVLGVASAGLRALSAIGALAKSQLGTGDRTDKVVDALMRIANMADSVGAGAAGEKSIEDVELDLQTFHATLLSNDESARAIEDARFPPQE